MRLIVFIYTAFFIVGGLFAQPVISVDTVNNMQNNNSLNSSSQKIVKSINDNKSREEIAESYYTLAQELMKKGDYVKAETYINKAIQEISNKKKNKRTAEYYRELAKVQEILKKTGEATKNYSTASDLSKDKTQQIINANDAERLRNPSNPELELQYLNQNAQILSSSDNRKERAYTYTQIANTNRAMNQPEQALENYKNALSDVGEKSPEAINIKSDMANLLAETENYEQAINIQKEVVEQSQKMGNVQTQTQQMRQLSDIYFKNKSTLEGLKILQDAYALAMERGNVKEAKASLDSLIRFYEKTGQNQQSLKLYSEFVAQLDTLIAKDSSLIDIKLFQVTEDKIEQLEKEKMLKDELIERKSNYNLMLIASVLMLIILMLLIIKGWFSIRKRNKQIALQSLRREMNPHFIFNSLNSVNQFIASNNELEANKYLTSYSNLMRKMMENSNNDYVPLNMEIDQLKKYLDLEKLRFPDTFEYILEADPNLDIESVNVPNMLIQPNLENAIWHGLRYKETRGILSLKFRKEGRKTVAIIEDNGIGLEESLNIKTKNQKLHESRGLKNVQERIRLLNDIYKTNIRFEIKEREGAETGVIVRIEW